MTELHSLLESAINRVGRDKILKEFSLSQRTLTRWESGNFPQHKGMIFHALSDLINASCARPENNHDFTFIDLFAGIGGTRIAFERANGKCVFTSEWDRFAQQTYRENHPSDHEIYGDITELDTPDKIFENIPDHNVLLAGFPCQPFSIAGVSKKNSLGKSHGFECDTQGTLFFNIEQILTVKRPEAFLLENVRNLKSHDKGNTYRTIKHTLETKLGYKVFDNVIDAKGFVPQHRERIFIVGFKKQTNFTWDDFNIPKTQRTLSSILHKENGEEIAEGHFTVGKNATVDKRYILSAHLWKYLKDYAAKHKARGNGFGYGLVNPDDTSRTLSARYYKDGSEILVNRGGRRHPRRLTPRECARLMGFDDSFKIPVSDTQAYKQFGNSVVVPVVDEVARIMKPALIQLIEEGTNQKIAA